MSKLKLIYIFVGSLSGNSKIQELFFTVKQCNAHFKRGILSEAVVMTVIAEHIPTAPSKHFLSQEHLEIFDSDLKKMIFRDKLT